MQSQTIKALAISSLFILGSSSANAESSCKGSAQKACEQATSCTWVQSYERSDGKSVSGYCRVLPQRPKVASADDQDKKQ